MTSQLHTNREKPAASILRMVLAIAAVAFFIGPVSPVCLAQAGSAVRSGAAADTMHVTVGHSFVLDSKSRLRRVYIADPAILDSITLSPNQIIVTAMAPGITSLILLDEDGQAQSHVVSADVDVEGLRVAMSQAMRSDAVNVQGSAGRVILSGTVGSDAASDSAVKLASLYSKEVANALVVTPTHPKQVRLKVRILEIDRSKLAQWGVNLFNPGGNTSFLASATTSQFPSSSTLTSGAGNLPGGTLTTSNPLNFLLYSSKLNLGSTVQDLETKQVLQILAEPTITTISGEKADFLSGGEFPFPVVQPGGGAGTTAVVTIQFRPYGVKVEFTPTVNEDGTIRLKVAPEVSALDYTNAVTISGSTVPALSTRRAETEVELRSDQSFAISGLLDQRTTDLLSKTPGISSIPILGALFKSKNVNHSTTELVVVVTPTVVDPLSEMAEPTQPDIPVAPLNKGTFDDSLGKNHNPTPAAPPLHPGEPFSSNPAPAALPLPAPVAQPATGVAQNLAPSQTLQVAPVSSTSVPDVVVVAPPPPAPAFAQSFASAPAAVVAAPAQTFVSAAPAAVPAPAPVPVSYQPYRPVALADPPTVRAAAPQASVASPSLPRHTFSRPPSAQSQPSSSVALVDQPSVRAAAPAAKVASPGVQQYSLNRPSAVPAAPAAAAKVVVTPLSAGRPMVQIMALSHNQDADAMVTALKRSGYSVAVSHDPKDSLLHLEVGPFASNTAAEAMRQRLLLEGYNATVK